tara:strand:+ start:568 stop:678 length:111 start_codon:yes stop_codon:yes gene_type:complete
MKEFLANNGIEIVVGMILVVLVVIFSRFIYFGFFKK